MIAAYLNTAMSQNPFWNQIRFGKRKQCLHTNLATTNKLPPLRMPSYDSLPRDLDTFTQGFPDLANFSPAPQGPGSELFALSEMYVNLRQEYPVAEEYLNYAQDLIEFATPAAPPPSLFNHDHVPPQSFIEACSHLVVDKHPGYPACRFSPTKGFILDDEDLFLHLYTIVNVRIFLLSMFSHVCATPEDFCSMGFADPSCVSIKHEVVKTGKNGRILNSSSIVDELIERLLYTSFMEQFKDHRFETYSAIGIGFTRRDADLMTMVVPLPSATSDVPNWDASMSTVEALLNVQTKLHSYGDVPSFWANVMHCHEMAMMNKAFILSDGLVLVQTTSGGQNTGRFMTSGDNTQGRARRSYAVTLYAEVVHQDVLDYNMICAGDDSDESPDPQRLDYYGELGFPLRDFEINEDHVSFCSHDWYPGRLPVGQRFHKALYNLILNVTIDFEQFYSFSLSFSRHPDYQAVVDFLSEHRPEMKIIKSRIEAMKASVQQSHPNIVLCKSKRKKETPVTTLVVAQPKPKAKKKKSRKPAKMRSPLNRSMICALTDPFCSHAVGAKFPDQGAQRTFTEQVKCMTTISTDAAGNHFASLAPNPLYQSAGAGYAAGTWTVGNFGAVGSAPFMASYVGKGVSYRINSWGAQITVISNAMSACGSVIVGTGLIGYSDTQVHSSTNYTSSKTFGGTAGSKFAVISKPLNEQATLYSQATTPNSYAPGWETIHINTVGGPPNTTHLMIEIVYNIEWYVDFAGMASGQNANDPVMKLASPSPPQNDMLQTARSSVYSALDNIQGGTSRVIGRAIENLATRALRYSVSAAAGYFGGPGAASLAYGSSGMIMNVD